MHFIAAPLSSQRLALFISVLLSCQLDSFFVDGQASFTEKPPNKLYVLRGKNAIFPWDYEVVNKKDTFDLYSPKWSFYDENGTEHEIGNEYRFNAWNWNISSKCPQRLLKPTLRVFKEENATLVITKVTPVDNGLYGCTLVLKSPPSKESKVRLIVTDNPQITPIPDKTDVDEYTNLTFNCSAVGPPTPNITWINDAGIIRKQGIQFAVLTFTNITRKQAGIYKCNATNNPNEDPVQKNTFVAVRFPPEVNETLSSGPIEACPGDEKELVCTGEGYPPPTYQWYNPQNESMGPGKKTGEIKVTVAQGNWTCYITNGIGQGAYYKVPLTVLREEHKFCKKLTGNVGCTTAKIVGFALGLLIAAVIIAVITVVILKKKKEKKEWKDWTTLEKVFIVFGLLVAIVIIIVVIVFIARCA